MVNVVKSKSKTTVKGNPATQPESAAPRLPTDQLAEALSKLTPNRAALVKQLVESFGDDPAPSSEPQPAPKETTYSEPDDLSAADRISAHVLGKLLLSLMLPSSVLNLEGISGGGLHDLWLNIHEGVERGLYWSE